MPSFVCISDVQLLTLHNFSVATVQQPWLQHSKVDGGLLHQSL